MPIPLGDHWLNCILLSRAGEVGELPNGRAREMELAMRDHLETYPAAAHGSLWFDCESGICFSASQLRGGPCGKDYNFLSTPEEFLHGMWGRRFVEGSIDFNDTFRDLPIEYDSEFMLGVPHSFEALRASRILVVLGGPTTKRVRWESFECDHVWSCNKFYMSPRVSRLDLALVALAPDVPLGDNPLLHQYLEEHGTRTAFEVERGGPVGRWRPVNQFVDRYSDRCGFFHTRYQSALGLGTRLLLFAIFLGVSDIAFVGLDGMSDRGPLHAFEPYKSNPLWYERFGPSLQRRQYVVFWEYVLSLQEERGFRLYNLGEVSPVNVSREISLRHFPLPKAVARRLLA